MASPAAKHARMTVALRKLELAAQEAGSEEQLERFTSHMNQPVYGDFEMQQILVLEAAADLLADSVGLDVEEDELSEEAQIYEYRESDGKMYKSNQDLSGTEGPENPSGQLLDDEPGPSDERDAPSDEDVEATFSESDINMSEQSEKNAQADEEAADPNDDVPIAEGEEDDEDDSPESTDSQEENQ